MKKLYLFAIIALIALNISSCKKDDAKKAEEPTISGNWKVTALSTDYIFGDKTIGTLSNQPITDYVEYINFKSDGTGTMSSGGVTIRKFKYYIADSVIHFSEVTDLATNTPVGTGGFISYISKFDNAKLEVTDKVYIFTVEQFENARYDQIQRHLSLIKQ